MITRTFKSFFWLETMPVIGSVVSKAENVNGLIIHRMGWCSHVYDNIPAGGDGLSGYEIHANDGSAVEVIKGKGGYYLGPVEQFYPRGYSVKYQVSTQVQGNYRKWWMRYSLL